jgi:hypothetical protein
MEFNEAWRTKHKTHTCRTYCTTLQKCWKAFTNKRNSTYLISPAEYLRVYTSSDVALWWNYEIFSLWTLNIFKLLHAVTQFLEALRKVSCSFPNCVIGIFHWRNPSGRPIFQGYTQPLTEMSTRNISWRVNVALRRAENITTFTCRLPWSLWALNFWNPQGLYRALQELLYLCCFTYLFSVTCRNIPYVRCVSVVSFCVKVSTSRGKMYLMKHILH